MRDREAVQEAMFRLMQVLPGVGSRFTVHEMDLAINNVLEHHEERIISRLLKQVNRLPKYPPYPGEEPTLIDGQAVIDLIELIRREVDRVRE
jgi:hypothetical protein